MFASKDWEIPDDMYDENRSQEWNYYSDVLEDESFLSWFTRLAKDNCSDARILFQQLNHPNSLQNLNMKMLGERLFSVLICTTKQTKLISQIQPFLDQKIGKFRVPPYILNKSRDNLDTLNLPLAHPRFCPLCLKNDDKAYFRDWWFFKPHVVCPVHNCILFDACPHCNSPIEFWDTNWNQPITHCSNCNKDISEDYIGVFYLHNVNYYELLESTFEQFSKVAKLPNQKDFFKRIWEIIISKRQNTWIKNANHISSADLLPLILISAKELSKNPRKVTSIEILERIKIDQLTLLNFEKEEFDLSNELSNETVRNRFIAIAPLLKKIPKTYDDVKQQAQITKIAPRTLYHWMKLYQERGLVGLIPQYHKSGRRSPPLPVEFDKIVQTSIIEFVKTGELTSMKSLFRKLHQIAQTMEINEKQFTYLILRKRIIRERKRAENCR
jgi:hypothetical protein